MRPCLEVADIFRRHGDAYRVAHGTHMGRVEHRIMGAIEVCRTAARPCGAWLRHDATISRHAAAATITVLPTILGQHRHCPKCQGLTRAEWLADRQAVSGKGTLYHDDAIMCALCLRQVFGLALRQTQGFLRSLAAMLDLDVSIPHYSTLSRRAGDFEICVQSVSRRTSPLCLVIDGTGLKVFGEGEWKVRALGAGKRCVWRKLHLGVDATSGQILAMS